MLQRLKLDRKILQLCNKIYNEGSAIKKKKNEKQINVQNCSNRINKTFINYKSIINFVNNKKDKYMRN